MVDLKIVNSVLSQLEEERGIPREKIIEAIELALATAYKKEYGKRGQIIRSHFDINTGKSEFFQVKVIVDESTVRIDAEEEISIDKPEFEELKEGERKVLFNPEHHILLSDAQKIKKDALVGEELVFPLTIRDDFGRIASQTAKQVIIQKIREAEKDSVMKEYGEREGEIVSGTVQRIERGNIFIDLGRATGFLPRDEQIQGEHYRQGERVRGYLYRVEETPRGIFLRVSRTHPQLLQKLFELETPELTNGTVEIKAIAREPGSRTKIAVHSNDDNVDPVGSLVGGRGVRVSTVMSELGGEKIDIIEWSEEPLKFIEDALSPAQILSVKLNEEEHKAVVEVAEDQQSLAIGKGGQNVRLAAKLTGWKIDIQSSEAEKNRKEAEEKEEEENKSETNETKTEAEEVSQNENVETEEVKEEDVEIEEEKEDPTEKEA